MNTEESNFQCPNDNEYMLWADDVNDLGMIYQCPQCGQYWEVDLGYDPETYDELFYIYPYKKQAI